MNRHPDRYVFKTDSSSSRERTSPVLLPRVNVVVTCFNYGQFVGAALDSVAAQTYADFDCVIVDDASTDNSSERLSAGSLVGVTTVSD
jgi:hypothetical protein